MLKMPNENAQKIALSGGAYVRGKWIIHSVLQVRNEFRRATDSSENKTF